MDSSDEEESIVLRQQREFQPLYTRAVLLKDERSHRRYINRDRAGSHNRIWNDYFRNDCKYPLEYFRRRFRMRRELFMRILSDVEAHDVYFTQRNDALSRQGLSGLQKMTATIRLLSYDYSTDCCDEYLQIRETTIIENMKHFCDIVIASYKSQYMRAPNTEDVARLLQEGNAIGFLGMLESLDCMHWEWKNYPTAWHDTHRGHHNKPTLILEAVASKDLWIWHAFFGVTIGSHNDLNILEHSPLFDNIIYGRHTLVNYKVNGHQYTMGYFLSDGIYPKWATLIQSISHSTSGKERLFAMKYEATRKDMEHAFGVLQSRWTITHGPVKFWKKNDLCKIMKMCIILHNMIIEDERQTNLEPWVPLQEENIELPTYARDPALLRAHIASRLDRIRNKGINNTLRSDLFEHV
ncbi:hypothetical protein ACOSQ3_023825 [Xanthoceras sorbifolium]